MCTIDQLSRSRDKHSFLFVCRMFVALVRINVDLFTHSKKVDFPHLWGPTTRNVMAGIGSDISRVSIVVADCFTFLFIAVMDCADLVKLMLMVLLE